MVTPSPDVVKIAVDYLAAHADVTAAGCAGVSTRLPADFPARAGDVWIVVEQIDAGFRDPKIAWTDEVHLDIDVVGDPDDPAAETKVSLVQRTARPALLAAHGYRHATEGLVVDVDDISGPHWLPSGDDPPKPRYVFSIVMKAHP